MTVQHEKNVLQRKSYMKRVRQKEIVMKVVNTEKVQHEKNVT